MNNNKDNQGKNRIFNLRDGNYTEKIEGDFIQGDVIGSNSKAPVPAPRKDYSEEGDAIDVEVKEER